VRVWLLSLLFCCVLVPALRADQPAAKISDAKKGDDDVLVHKVESPHQDRTTTIRVLLPKKLDKRHRVVYVLPVEAGDGKAYGDGLAEVKKHGLHDKYGLVCVAPTFARLPWYADHPSDPKLAQESHLLKVVLPFVEKTYPVLAKPEGRLLLGFSKSGWGPSRSSCVTPTSSAGPPPGTRR
jgi:hypothetical protein